MPGKALRAVAPRRAGRHDVTWKNDDAINHTVTADGDAFSSGYVPPGGSFSFAFAKQGRYPFHCTIHKFMKGEVDVFGLVLSGPEGPVVAGSRVVFAGLAPAGAGDRDAPRRRGRAHGSCASRRQLRRRRDRRGSRRVSSRLGDAGQPGRARARQAGRPRRARRETRSAPAPTRRVRGRRQCCSPTIASTSPGGASPGRSSTHARACASRSQRGSSGHACSSWAGRGGPTPPRGRSSSAAARRLSRIVA